MCILKTPLRSERLMNVERHRHLSQTDEIRGVDGVELAASGLHVHFNAIHFVQENVIKRMVVAYPSTHTD